MLFKKMIPYLLFATLLNPSVFAQSWERASGPSGTETFLSLLPHPADPGKMIAASGTQIFENIKNGFWENIWQTRNASRKIHRLHYFKETPNYLFILTSDGLFAEDLKDKSWKMFYRGKTALEKSVLSFAVSPKDPAHWFVGTESGLLESDDAGKSWFRFGLFKKDPVPVLYFSKDKLYVGTQKSLYASEDQAYFKNVFTLGSAVMEELSDALKEDDSYDPSENSGSYLHELISSENQNKLYLATRKGVFETIDGENWTSLSQSGLRSSDVEHLIYSEKTKQLFAGTGRGIYTYLSATKRWSEMFQGLEQLDISGMALARDKEDKEKEMLFASTAGGIFRYQIFPETNVKIQETSPEANLLFQELLRFEPSAKEIQHQVIQYNDVSNEKIKRWHASSRAAALLPSFNFGKDFSKSPSIDIDRGGTSDKDFYIKGPDTVRNAWDMGASWDLGDFLFSSNQTSIDSREKLMVELRQDLLAEATRTFYERRRLQMEILFQPAATEQEHLEKLLRLDELRSLLDGMTGGFLSKRLNQIYEAKPSLHRILDFAGVNELSQTSIKI